MKRRLRQFCPNGLAKQSSNCSSISLIGSGKKQSAPDLVSHARSAEDKKVKTVTARAGRRQPGWASVTCNLGVRAISRRMAKSASLITRPAATGDAVVDVKK